MAWDKNPNSSACAKIKERGAACAGAVKKEPILVNHQKLRHTLIKTG